MPGREWAFDKCDVDWVHGWMNGWINKWMNKCYSWIGVSWHINIKDHYMSIPKYHRTLGDLWQIPIYRARWKFWDTFSSHILHFWNGEVTLNPCQPGGSWDMVAMVCSCVQSSGVVLVVWKECMEWMEDGFKEMWHHQHPWHHSIWKITISLALSWTDFRRDNFWM